MQEFNPSRLKFARSLRRLTMVKLAELIGVEQRSISGYERGEFKPEDDKLQELSKKLRFPISFFYGDDIEGLSPDAASFRSMSKMTAGQRDSALGMGALALQLNEWIEKRFELPEADLPDLSHETNPEMAAEAVRRYWGLGELPIKNMIHLLEAKGIRVFSLSIDAQEVDAFSMWRDSTPFIFLNTKKSSERSRFDAAHELGHLVMHRHGGPHGRDAEKEANAFASAFLMPRASVFAQAPRLVSLPILVQLKKRWTVSVFALAHRLYDLGLITEWNYRTLCIEISSSGYRKTEPQEAPRETSQILGKVLAALREDGISKNDIAADLCVYAEEIEQLVFRLAITGISGTSDGAKTQVSKRPNLRVVT